MGLLLTYKYRLLPTRAQHRALETLLEDQRHLYNAALQERIECYRKTGKGKAYYDQCKGLTELRSDAEYSATPLNIQRWTLKRVDDAYRAFFCRVATQKGDAGFPRFRGKGWWKSFGFAEFVGIHFDGRAIRFKGVNGSIQVNQHRPLPSGKILSCVFTRDIKGWSIGFHTSVEVAEKRLVTSAAGIDVGITSLVAASDGLIIQNPRAARRAERELRRRQRALTRCSRGSARRRKARTRVARLHSKIKNTRATALHQISAMLVSKYDAIAVEALNTKGLARGILAREVNDASWGRLRELLRYKAERAGAHFVEVDPKFTSQTCPDCGQVAAKTLAERTHMCDCGCVLDRDVAAARVILERAVVGPWARNVAGCGERVPGNTNANSIGTPPEQGPT